MGEGRTSAVISYFRGPREQWHTGLPTFRRLVYRDLWPGIDLVYEGTVSRLKYSFLVAPGADPRHTGEPQHERQRREGKAETKKEHVVPQRE